MSSIIDKLDLIGGLLGLVVVPILAFELLYLWRRRQMGFDRVLEMVANSSALISNGVASVLATAAWIPVYVFVSRLVPWDIPTTALTAIVAVVATDFFYYWEHRLSHENRLMWAIGHSVHHSSNYYDATTALRTSFVDNFTAPVFYIPLLVAGFSPALVLAAFAFQTAYQTWLHTERIGKLRWLDGWLNTPSNHRVHHGSQAQYLDRNYAAIFVVWDRLFGTYEPEREPVRYGLTTPIQTHNPITFHIHD